MVRVKHNLIYKRIEERDLSDNVHPEVLIDEIVSLKGNEKAEQYPNQYGELPCTMPNTASP